MAYIKISDPHIVDLAAWHQVINVVNQHSDTINALTNNFGTTGNLNTNFNAESFSHTFDSGSQQIVYGKIAINGNTSKVTTAATKTKAAQTVYYGTAVFAQTGGVSAFSTTPFVTATWFGPNSSTSSPDLTNVDVVLSIYNIKFNQFSWKAVRTNGAALDSLSTSGNSAYINWMAIGPR